MKMMILPSGFNPANVEEPPDGFTIAVSNAGLMRNRKAMPWKKSTVPNAIPSTSLFFHPWVNIALHVWKVIQN
jgi:hypothetical protein